MNMQILDAAIGLVFIYTLYSLLVTIMNEIIATFFSVRARVLSTAIERMLDEQAPTFWKYLQKRGNRFFKTFLAGIYNILPFSKKMKMGNADASFYDEFYNSPIIKYMGKNKIFKRPSYISASTFSKNVIDLLRQKGADPGAGTPLTSSEEISKALEKADTSLGPDTRAFLSSLWDDAKKDTDKFRSRLENWFDEMMVRARGWYKRKTQWASFGLGLIVAVIFNVNTIAIVNHLGHDGTTATQLADMAKTYVDANKNNPRLIKTTGDSGRVITDTLPGAVDTANALLHQARILVDSNITSANSLIGLGWKINKDSVDAIADKHSAFIEPFCIIKTEAQIVLGQTTRRDWIGFILTALAISLGAPFWFDILSKLVQLRGAGGNGEGKNPKKENGKDGKTDN